MKKQKIKKFSMVVIIAIVLSLLIVATAFAATKNYNGLTTVNYNNYIDDYSGGWNARYYDRTQAPAFSMDQFGVSFWSVYCSCNGTVIPSTYYSRSNMIEQNRVSVGDSLSRPNYNCPYGQTLRGHNYIQHWWQDGGYSGDGGTINSSRVLSYP